MEDRISFELKFYYIKIYFKWDKNAKFWDLPKIAHKFVLRWTKILFKLISGFIKYKCKRQYPETILKYSRSFILSSSSLLLYEYILQNMLSSESNSEQ